MVERGPEKAGVGGSIPSLATILVWDVTLKRLASAVRFRPWPPCFAKTYERFRPSALRFGVQAESLAAAILQFAKKRDLKQFGDAIDDYNRICGRDLTDDQKNQVHDAIHGQGADY
jgi:hypothetical protein